MALSRLRPIGVLALLVELTLAAGQQDVEFAAQFAALSDQGNMQPEQREHLEQVASMRSAAVKQMEKILDIAQTLL